MVNDVSFIKKNERYWKDDYIEVVSDYIKRNLFLVVKKKRKYLPTVTIILAFAFIKKQWLCTCRCITWVMIRTYLSPEMVFASTS